MITMRMTRNGLKRFGERCIRLPYGNPITNGCQNVGWNEGKYGWNYSVYTLEGFDGILIEGYRSFPSWSILPAGPELAALYEAYKNGDHALLVELLNSIKGNLKDGEND